MREPTDTRDNLEANFTQAADDAGHDPGACHSASGLETARALTRPRGFEFHTRAHRQKCTLTSGNASNQSLAADHLCAAMSQQHPAADPTSRPGSCAIRAACRPATNRALSSTVRV